jgi:carbon storage regulator
MLVLGRKPGEKIIIGDNIIISVLESSSPSTIRIGIDAPRDISVHREEIYKKIKSEIDFD